MMSPFFPSFLVLGTLLALSGRTSAAPALLTVVAPFPASGSVTETVIPTVVVLGVNAEGQTAYGEQDVFKSSTTIDATVVLASDFISQDNGELGVACTAQSGDSVCNMHFESSDLGTTTVAGLQTLVLDVVSTAATPTIPLFTAAAQGPQATGKADSSSAAGRVSARAPLFGALMGLLLAYHLA
ncbi:hypothetical protein C8R46DRAFT_1117496 [Mycena filopes]|nr:hypothetical protein C8R46DRAFT_1117496 [Mycena filopes]